MTKDFNNLIDFISNDVAASNKLNPLRWTIAFAAALPPILINTLMGHNHLLDWRQSWTPWAIAALFGMTVVYFAICLGRRVNVTTFGITGAFVLIAVLLLSTHGPGFVPMSGYPEYWADTFGCFGFGMMTGTFTGLSLAIALFLRGPIPNSGTRVTLSHISGMSGVVGLFFHCPNSDLIHLFTGHGSQAVAVFLLTYFLTEKAFSKVVKHQLGAAAGRFERLENFDK